MGVVERIYRSKGEIKMEELVKTEREVSIINFQVGLARFHQDKNAYHNFLKKFKEQRLFFQFLEHIRFKQKQQALEDCFLLIGVCNNLGFDQFKEVLLEIQGYWTEDGVLEQDYRRRLENAYQEVCQAIEALENKEK